MKKLLTVLSILLVVSLFAGCSLLPTSSPVDQKVATDPTANLFNYDGLTYSENQVLIRVNSDVNLDSMMAKQGSSVLEQWDNIGWALVTVPEGETALSFISQLKSQKGILLAEPDFVYHVDAVDPVVPTVPRYNEQWGFKNMNAEAAWAITKGSENVIVAILDTGVEVDHPEFESKTFVGAHNAIDGSDDVTPTADHGTHVAGIAADNGADGQIAGVAWDCPIMPVAVENREGNIFTSYLINGMIYVANYAKDNTDKRIVVNMSIGGRGYNFAFKDAIDYAFDNGVLLVTSAGNDYKRLPSYPSAYNGVVSVAASTPYDTKADFSTKGSFNSVAAPGVLILSTVTGNGYGNMQGTSMASPYVAGAAALLLSKYPDLSPLQIKNQLEQTARGNGYTEELGYGVVDIEALLGELKPMQYGGLDVTTNIVETVEGDWVGLGILTVFDAEGNMVAYGTTGEAGNHAFHALKPGEYKVNLTYYDLFGDKYNIDARNVTVAAETVANINFVVDVVTALDRTEVHSEVINVAVADGCVKTVPYTVETEGLFEFQTDAIDEANCDTVLTLMTSDKKTVLATNDDSGIKGNFSYIGMIVPAGDYLVVVEEFDADAPLNCVLNIYSTVPVYGQDQ